MRNLALPAYCILTFFAIGFAQKPASKPSPKKLPAAVPVKADMRATSELGNVSGRTYSNTVHGFRIAFPDTWVIADRDYEDVVKSKGFDISLKAPENLSGPAKLQVEKALENIKLLVTAYRSSPGSTDNAILRVSVEDLRTVPAVKDAVDYFDLMRSQFAVMKLPADFKYSETQAEKLGAKQFAFLDTSSTAGKKRMYATVRNGFAIMFTLSYTRPEDIATMRQILATGNFALK
ncbi:MAG TPA: hypothetical protein VJ781_01930 [Pyrinomonadaceae bacterium]|nr:hypothetical protein [Pyrinomonadaceae bacterium]